MAIVNGGKILATVRGAAKRYVTFSGTVKLSGTGVVRTILVYRENAPDVSNSTTSDASGNWSITMAAGSNDKFRIIAVGIDGENSEIFEHVQG